MNDKNIPPLGSKGDIGARFMNQNHRKTIFEKFGYTREDMPRGVKLQKLALMEIRQEQPEEYEKWYDTIVRGVMPQAPKAQVDDSTLRKVVREEMEENLGKMSNNVQKFAESEIEKAVREEAKKLNRNIIVVENKSTGKKKEIEDPVPEQFEDMIRLAENRVNIFLHGPSGCGKTHISKVLADALGLPFGGQSCSAGMSESIFSGWLLPIAKGGSFEYVPSEFIKIYEGGGVFLFDEIDASDPNTLLFLNQALANSEFHLPQRFNNPKIKKHPDFIAIAAANTNGNGATLEYNGREKLDGATMDRFRMGIIEMDYSPVVEERLVNADVLTWGRLVRKTIQERRLTKICSTRMLLDATKMKSAGWNLGKIQNQFLSDWKDDDANIVRSKVSMMLDLED